MSQYEQTTSVSILIVYHSVSGATERLALAIADGVHAEGAEAVLRYVGEAEDSATFPAVCQDDLLACDGLALGSPTRFGCMASPVYAWLERTSELWLKGQLIDKPACVFTSSGSQHGGQEATLLGMSVPLIHHGMVLVGVPYSVSELNSTTTGGTPYGASMVAGFQHQNSGTKDELQIAIAQGKRLAQLARMLKYK